MSSKKLVIAATAIFVVSLFLIPPALACYYPGPEGSSITVTAHASDGTPLPGTNLKLTVSNGSETVATESGTTGDGGKFMFPNDGSNKIGLSYTISATYYGDTFNAECEGNPHTADVGPFTLTKDEKRNIDITIPGVTVVHGGEGATATPDPTNSKPGEDVGKPLVPKGNHSNYPPMAPGQSAGTVAGVILKDDGETPICGAYVAIVSAADPSIEYSCMYTDSNGFYMFYNVNSTIDAAYKIYAAKGCDKVAYSGPFSVGSGETEKINLVFISKGSDAGVLLPAEEPIAPAQPSDESPSATPVPPVPAGEHGLVATSHNGGGLLEQITGFIGAVISRILPGI